MFQLINKWLGRDKEVKEKEFIPGIKGVLESNPASSYWIFPSLLFLLVVTLFIWLTLSETDVVSPTMAKIIPSSGLHLIQPKDQGKIVIVPVKEGEDVKKGQVLVQFEKKDLEIEIETIQKEKQLVHGDIFRLERIAGLTNEDSVLKKDLNIPLKILRQEKSLTQSQIDLFNSEMQTLETKIEKAEKEKKNLQAEISKLNRLIAYNGNKIRKLRSLVQRKIIPSEQYEQLIEGNIVRKEDKKIKIFQLKALNSEIKLSQDERRQHQQSFYKDNNQKLLEAYQRLESLKMKEKKAVEVIKSKVIQSPIDGVVHNLQVHTVGSIVRSGDIMMQIIPKDTPIEVEANVLNRDIGFIHVGQKIKFKVDSFPFTKYGYIPGTIKKIEHAAVKDEKLGDIYPTIVELDDNKIKVNDKWVQLIPGMTGVVDIQTGKRRMIDYILSPFRRYKDEAMKER